MERFANSVPGFLSAYMFAHDASSRRLDEIELQDVFVGCEGWIWLHLNLTDQRCGRWLSRHCHQPEDLIAEFVTPSRRHYLREAGPHWVGQLPAFRRGDSGDPSDTASVSVLVSKQAIITGRTKPLHAPEVLRAELARGAGYGQPFDILAGLLDVFIRTTEDIHHDLLEELEVIEDRVLDNRSGNERQRLMVARRDSAAAHRHVRSLKRALMQTARIRTTVPPSLEVAASQLSNLDMDFDSMEQRARFFHDEIDAKLASETNRQLYVLSIVTALFLPPSLVAGLFGMNVKGIPWSEASHGFWYAFASGVLSAVAVATFIGLSNRKL